ncbi:MAG: hypothetical protein K2G52_03770 [Muribaculaceae bacterium]|nr:hypothetical protein [Muribaculaceae bacterium]
MVKGIEKFKEHFSKYQDNYVIIGGTACEVHEDAAGQKPRTTKDIDMILIIEALSHDFVSEFWEFVKAARYEENHVGEKGEEPKQQYYRFNKPANLEYPTQVELFSRSLDVFELPPDLHITPIPTDADLSSLSAILLDDEYYDYTLKHSTVEESVHISNVESLIVLKCKAYLEMKKRKAETGEGDERHIRKHRNDVFRLVASISSGEQTFALPEKLYDDVASFRQQVETDMPDANLIKDMGLRRITPEDLLERLNVLFLKA